MNSNCAHCLHPLSNYSKSFRVFSKNSCRTSDIEETLKELHHFSGKLDFFNATVVFSKDCSSYTVYQCPPVVFIGLFALDFCLFSSRL